MAESALLSPIARNVLGDAIIKRLVALIVETGLKPGDRLPSERALQTKFAVGRSSMREAIKSLAAIGLVEVRPGSGRFVGRGEPTDLTRGLPWGLLLSEADAGEVVEARQVVEPELAAFAAERGTNDELAAICRSVEVMRHSLRDVEAYTRANVEFHLAIAQAAHNHVLGRVFDSLQHMVRLWTRRSFDPTSLPEHEAICEAIQARDARRARAAMAGHLRTMRERAPFELQEAPSPRVPAEGPT